MPRVMRVPAEPGETVADDPIDVLRHHAGPARGDARVECPSQRVEHAPMFGVGTPDHDGVGRVAPCASHPRRDIGEDDVSRLDRAAGRLPRRCGRRRPGREVQEGGHPHPRVAIHLRLGDAGELCLGQPGLDALLDGSLSHVGESRRGAQRIDLNRKLDRPGGNDIGLDVGQLEPQPPKLVGDPHRQPAGLDAEPASVTAAPGERLGERVGSLRSRDRLRQVVVGAIHDRLRRQGVGQRSICIGDDEHGGCGRDDKDGGIGDVGVRDRIVLDRRGVPREIRDRLRMGEHRLIDVSAAKRDPQALDRRRGRQR